MMAYSDSYGSGPADSHPQGPGVSAIVGWLGAATSVALVAGLGYWVYDLATRDITRVPVIQAMDGPPRVSPEEPGGFEAAHQGYSVNAIASEDVEEPLAERLVLAPEAVGPTPEDKAPGEPADPLASMRDAVQGALSEVLGLEADAPLPDLEGLAVPQADPTPGGPRPLQRPDQDVATRAATDTSPPLLLTAVATTNEVDPILIASGTRLVQLGDYDTEAEAAAAWDRLGLRFSDFLAPKARVIEPVTLAGTTRYRLRAYGFVGLADARNFCAALLAERAECIPVRMR
ncbi:SPOR domain-containing protein [Meridianimarinicoccus sp. MJW13]|uniref:SPOR domain-containing protein n=1 Tax=Meridianimarinicoccus sp. MJW13 TaxID=2720031 RepID=UPI001868ED9B|nr:SPOR domain-containing protein [Fluviibacterium sp. MJW13]